MFEFINPEKRHEILENIIATEWTMFQKVTNINGRASCQDEWGTFHIMRYSHYNAWTDEMINSYAEDLASALKNKRNLVMEKYAYMMEFTQNEYYKNMLAPYLPKIDKDTLDIINQITHHLIEWEKEFMQKYPKLSKAGRPLENNSNNGTFSGGDTSIETYTLGELKTLSKNTLTLYLDYVIKSRAENKNIVLLVKSTMVKMSGYASLEDAERKA